MTEDGTFDIDAASGRHDQNQPSAYEVLLRQYRDTLARNHVLEMEVQNLKNVIMQPDSDTPLPGGPALTPPMGTDALVARLEALESRSIQVLPSRPETNAAHAEESTTKPADDQISQLRVQNHSLESRLAKVTEQLDEMKLGRTRRHRNGSRGRKDSSKPGPLRWLLRK